MLFVDDDEAKVGERQKQSRARADNDRRLPARHRRPDAFALPLSQTGMPFGGSFTEARREPIEKLPGERNLRQQHQRLPFLPQSLRNALEINLRLARTRHTLEQGCRESAIGDEADEIVGRGALIGVEARRAEVRIKRGRAFFRRKRD